MSMAGEAFHSGHRGRPAPRSRFFGGLGSGGSFAESLARESTGVLLHSGFGGQLLSVSLGEGGVGLSQGENDHNPSFAFSCFNSWNRTHRTNSRRGKHGPWKTGSTEIQSIQKKKNV